MALNRSTAAVSVGEGVELLGAALQPVAILQVAVVAFRDPLGAVKETPTTGGDYGCAVTVAWTQSDVEVFTVVKLVTIAAA